MRTSTAFLALILALPGLAQAQATSDPVAYQNLLLNRKLSADDLKICTDRLGQKTADNQNAWDICTITRNFIADYSTNKNAVFPYPPAAHISYTMKPEFRDFMDRVVASKK